MMKAIAGAIFRMMGWTPQPSASVPDKCVIVCYPHTSNWDLFILQLTAFYFGQHLNWLGKKEIFAPGIAGFMRSIGGIPVDRSAPQGMVKQVAAEFARADKLRLCIPPEGTRSKVEYWKSGFYRIAMEAGVPLQIAEVCFRRKVVGFGITIHPTGDIKADMDKIRAYLAGKYGKYPELSSPIRLRDEEPAVPADTINGKSRLQA